MSPESDKEGAPKSSNSRWWEYDAMRYALGVGIGAPIVVLLWGTYGDALSPKLSIPSPFSGTVAALFWAAAGTAYCYVASVPMLTLHSTRRLLLGTKWWVIACFVSVLVALIGAAALDLFLISNLLVLQCTGVVARSDRWFSARVALEGLAKPA
jgi:hypothetical protein